MSSLLLSWLRDEVTAWSPSIVGVFREQAEHDWPIKATSPSDLKDQLTTAGHLLPLPSEPAALANVMEIEMRERILTAVGRTADAEVVEGTERSYPDLELSGPAFGGGPRAVDIKCARRNKTGNGLKSRIALYTGNTYFLWPQLKFSGIARPFGEYQELISLVVIYSFEPDRPERITNVRVAAHESWRIASRSRASTTREYIGSVNKVDDVLEGHSEFESAEEFYEYWRHPARRWKQSPEAERLLRQALNGN